MLLLYRTHETARSTQAGGSLQNRRVVQLRDCVFVRPASQLIFISPYEDL